MLSDFKFSIILEICLDNQKHTFIYRDHLYKFFLYKKKAFLFRLPQQSVSLKHAIKQVAATHPAVTTAASLEYRLLTVVPEHWPVGKS